MTDKKITSENNYNHLPDFSEDYKFLDFENTIQDISEKINALKSSAIESTEVNEQILALRKKEMLKQKRYIQDFRPGKLFRWQDTHKDHILLILLIAYLMNLMKCMVTDNLAMMLRL
jgi:methionyl-tRNA formyltransferase